MTLKRVLLYAVVAAVVLYAASYLISLLGREASTASDAPVFILVLGAILALAIIGYSAYRVFLKFPRKKEKP